MVSRVRPEDIAPLAALGMGPREIGRRLGRDHSTISRAAQRFGIAFAPKYQLREQDVRRLRNEGLTIREIAHRLGRSTSRVTKVLRAMGLAERGPLSGPLSCSRKRNARWEQKYPEKRRAHKVVEKALDAGRIQRMDCECCGEKKTHAHHDDYSRPLDVRWLCARCHKREHMMVAAQ